MSPQSKMEVEAISPGKACVACGRNNANALKFCLTCGHQFGTNSVLVYGPDRSAPTFCKHCGIDDPLNSNYCVVCGENMKAPVSTTTTAGPIKIELGNQLRASFAGKEKIKRPLTPTSAIRKSRFVHQSVGIGIAFSIIACIAVTNLPFVKYFAERISWPHSGLVVYVKPDTCRVTVSTLDRTNVQVAKPGPGNALSLDSLPEGEYRLKLEASGYKTISQIVKITSGKPTIVGYPKPILLSNQFAQLP